MVFRKIKVSFFERLSILRKPVSESRFFSLKPSLGLNCFAKLSPSVDFHKAIK